MLHGVTLYTLSTKVPIIKTFYKTHQEMYKTMNKHLLIHNDNKQKRHLNVAVINYILENRHKVNERLFIQSEQCLL